MSLESTSAPWASSNCTMAVLPSWAAMWSGVRSTFVLASRDIPARRSTSAVEAWPYWAARWSGLVPSCQKKLILTTSEGFSLHYLSLYLCCSQSSPHLYLLLSFSISVSSWGPHIWNLTQQKKYNIQIDREIEYSVERNTKIQKFSTEKSPLLKCFSPNTSKNLKLMPVEYEHKNSKQIKYILSIMISLKTYIFIIHT